MRILKILIVLFVQKKSVLFYKFLVASTLFFSFIKRKKSLQIMILNQVLNIFMMRDKIELPY